MIIINIIIIITIIGMMHSACNICDGILPVHEWCRSHSSTLNFPQPSNHPCTTLIYLEGMNE